MTIQPQRSQAFMTDNRPYRPNVGIALFNASGRVLIGRRFRDDGPEIILPGLEWQMPQGGIDAGENPRTAVMRELWEETGVANAEYLGETDWLSYEFPPFAAPSSHRLAKFRGQRQKWFALRFTGSDERNRSADGAQRPAAGVRPMAMGTARPCRRSRGAVPARCVSDRGAELRGVRNSLESVIVRCERRGGRD